MTAIRELFVLLGLETDTRDFARAEKAIGQVTQVAKALTVAVGAAVGTMGVMARQSLLAADTLGKWQNRVGGTIEELSALKFAAEASGIRAEQAFEGIVEVGERASDVVRNIKKLTGDAGESFKTLGFKSVKELQKPNGELREGIDLFDDVIKRLAKVKVASDRTGIAMRLLGDDVGQAFTAADIETLSRLRTEAQNLGVTMSKDNVRSARAFNRESAVLTATLGALRDQAVFGVLPAISKVTKEIREWITTNRKLIGGKIDRFVQRLTRAFKQALVDGRAYFSFLRDLWEGLGRLRHVLLGVAAAIAASKLGALVLALAAGATKLLGALTFLGALKFAGLVAFGGAVAFLILLLDSFIIRSKGGKSAIDDFIKAFEDSDLKDSTFVKGLKFTVDLLTRLIGLAKTGFELLPDLFRLSFLEGKGKLAGATGVAEGIEEQISALLGRGRQTGFLRELNLLRAASGVSSDRVRAFAGQDAQFQGMLSTLRSVQTLRPAITRVNNERLLSTPITQNVTIQQTVTGNVAPEQAIDARTQLAEPVPGLLKAAAEEVGE